jgi:hypothetical protein
MPCFRARNPIGLKSLGCPAKLLTKANFFQSVVAAELGELATGTTNAGGILTIIPNKFFKILPMIKY